MLVEGAEGSAATKAAKLRERRLKKAAARKRPLPAYRVAAERQFFQEVDDALTDRLEPLGADRWHRQYWWLRADPGRLWLHTPQPQADAAPGPILIRF